MTRFASVLPFFTSLKQRFTIIPPKRIGWHNHLNQQRFSSHSDAWDSLPFLLALGVPAGGRIWHIILRGLRRLQRCVAGRRGRRLLRLRDDLAAAGGRESFKWDTKKSRCCGKNMISNCGSIWLNMTQYLSRFEAIQLFYKILRRQKIMPWPGQWAHEKVLPLGLASLPRKCHRQSKRRNMEKVWINAKWLWICMTYKSSQ